MDRISQNAQLPIGFGSPYPIKDGGTEHRTRYVDGKLTTVVIRNDGGRITHSKL